MSTPEARAQVQAQVKASPKRRLRKTNKSRSRSAIKNLSAAQFKGKRKLSGAATGLLEDMLDFAVKRAMIDCAAICDTSGRKTVKLDIFESAVEMTFKSNKLYAKCDEIGKAAVTAWNAAVSGKTAGQKIKLSGDKSVIKHALSAGRVGKMMHKHMQKPCDRIAEAAIVYATGFFENFIASVMAAAAETDVAKSKERITAGAIARAMKLDLDLRAVIPPEHIVKYGGQSDGTVKKKRAAADCEKPKKKRSKKA